MCTVEYYTAVKRNKLLLPVIIWMNLTETTKGAKGARHKRVVTESSIYRKKKIGKSVQEDGCQNNGYVKGKVMPGWGHWWELWACWSCSPFLSGCGYLGECTL